MPPLRKGGRRTEHRLAYGRSPECALPNRDREGVGALVFQQASQSESRRSKMQVNMTRKWRHWALCAVLAIGSVLAAWSLDQVSFFQNLNLKAYDAHFVVRNYLVGPPAIPNIVLLTADQKAMNTFPELHEFWNKHY